MVVIDLNLLIKCRKFGLKTVQEINDFVKKYNIESAEEFEKVLDGEKQVYSIKVIDEGEI